MGSMCKTHVPPDMAEMIRVSYYTVMPFEAFRSKFYFVRYKAFNHDSFFFQTFAEQVLDVVFCV